MKKYNHDWLIAEWERMGRPEVEIFSVMNDVWIADQDPQFHSQRQYRIKSKPSINWEHVSEEFDCLVSNSGASILYTNMPKKFGDMWLNGGNYCLANAFASFTPGTCAWQDSLVMRPVVVGGE